MRHGIWVSMMVAVVLAPATPLLIDSAAAGGRREAPAKTAPKTSRPAPRPATRKPARPATRTPSRPAARQPSDRSRHARDATRRMNDGRATPSSRPDRRSPARLADRFLRDRTASGRAVSPGVPSRRPDPGRPLRSLTDARRDARLSGPRDAGRPDMGRGRFGRSSVPTTDDRRIRLRPTEPVRPSARITPIDPPLRPRDIHAPRRHPVQPKWTYSRGVRHRPCSTHRSLLSRRFNAPYWLWSCCTWLSGVSPLASGGYGDPLYRSSPTYVSYYLTGFNDSASAHACQWTLAEAWELLVNGDDAAFEAFECLRETLPDDGLPAVGYALAAALLERHDDAVAAMRDAIRADPDSLLYLPDDDRLEALLRAGAEYYDILARQSYGEVDSLFMVAALRYMLGEYEAADYAVEIAITLGDTDDTADILRRKIADNLTSPGGK